VIGIADDIDIGRIEIVTMACLSTFSGESAELVPIMMVVRESAKFKKIPETVMLKLEPRALLQISSQKREHDVGLSFQSFKELLNSGQDSSARAGKRKRKSIDVFLGECGDVFLFWVDLVFAQNITNNCAIGFSSNFDIVQVLTAGGPVDKTHVFATWAFWMGIQGGDIPLGATVSLFMFPILAFGAIFILRDVNKRGNEA